jgi:hypothetical protein
MSNQTQNNSTDQPGTDSGFPPVEQPAVSTIGSAAPTTVSEGTINDATTTASNLADV